MSGAVAVAAFEPQHDLADAVAFRPFIRNGRAADVAAQPFALECGDMGRYAHAENLLSQSARFLLKPKEAIDSIDEIEQTIKDLWYETARREGLSEKDCETIRPAFAYAGFRLPIGTAPG